MEGRLDSATPHLRAPRTRRAAPRRLRPPSPRPPHVLRSDPGPILSAWTGDERGTVLQPRSPLRVTTEWDTRLDYEKPRARVAAPYHVTPVARTARPTGSGLLAALAWTGTDRAESAPEQIVCAESAPGQIVRAAAGPRQLTHPKLGPWAIAHGSLPSLG